MKLFKAYLLSKKKSIGWLLLLFTLLILSFALYHLPIRAVLYPMVLCLLLGLLAGVLDFLHVRNKHRRLREIQRHAAVMTGELPAADSPVEQDYQELLREIYRELEQVENASNIRYREMTDYYTVWVHQIKTPIAAMNLTLQNEDTPVARKLSSDLFRIEQYVEMVLAFLRLDSVSSDYLFREQELDTIIKQAVAKFSSEFIDRKIGLEYEPTSKTLVTDEKWLSFVVEQVLSNALKYTKKGTISIRMTSPDTLCVRDSGVGIAPEDLPRVFEKGYTGYNGRTDKRASGIGLYLCKRICDSLGMGIRLESQFEKGTAVYIDLKQYTLRKD